MTASLVGEGALAGEEIDQAGPGVSRSGLVVFVQRVFLPCLSSFVSVPLVLRRCVSRRPLDLARGCPWVWGPRLRCPVLQRSAMYQALSSVLLACTLRVQTVTLGRRADSSALFHDVIAVAGCETSTKSFRTADPSGRATAIMPMAPSTKTLSRRWTRSAPFTPGKSGEDDGLMPHDHTLIPHITAPPGSCMANGDP
jgi:hypothetical protein